MSRSFSASDPAERPISFRIAARRGIGRNSSRRIAAKLRRQRRRGIDLAASQVVAQPLVPGRERRQAGPAGTWDSRSRSATDLRRPAGTGACSSETWSCRAIERRRRERPAAGAGRSCSSRPRYSASSAKPIGRPPELGAAGPVRARSTSRHGRAGRRAAGKTGRRSRRQRRAETAGAGPPCTGSASRPPSCRSSVPAA